MVITGQKKDIQVESLTTGGAASESAVQTIGANVQFLKDSADYSIAWQVNGNYNIIPGVQSLVDGKRGVYKNYAVYGFMLCVDIAGSGGSLEIDIVRTTSGGASASLFSTRPSVPASAGNNGRVLRRFYDSTTLVQSSGAVVPILSITNLSAGDVLQMNITSKQTGAPLGFTAELLLIGRN